MSLRSPARSLIAVGILISVALALGGAMATRAVTIDAPEPPATLSAPGPRLLNPDEVRTVLRDQPLELQFSAPLSHAEVSSSELRAHATVYAPDPHFLVVNVEAAVPDMWASLFLSRLAGLGGEVGPEQTIRVRTPQAVELLAAGDTTDAEVMAGSPILLRWNEPVRSLSYRLDGTPIRWEGPATELLALDADLWTPGVHELEIEDALAASGAWLGEQIRLEIRLVGPLMVALTWPNHGDHAIDPHTSPTLRFSEPILDREAAERSVALEPPRSGRFEWPAPDRLRFVPDEDLPADSSVVVRVLGGREYARGESGSFLENDMAASFETGPRKSIHVSLSTQRLTLIENDEPVWSAPIATGVRGADTPTGTYHVQYKMPRARFRGVNVNGSRYDIPDVRWVLPFHGDYTIHGAYWRGSFGRPASNGCVSMTDANAKVVYDWAAIDTPVIIER